MPSRARVAAFLAAALGAGAPALAQKAAAPDTPEIVVTGRSVPASPAEVNREARAVTEGGDFQHSPLARFEDRLCPGIFGLPQDFAAMMVGRIRDNARQFGVPLAKDGDCTANLLVAFVPHAQQQLAEMMRLHSYLFAGLAPAESRALVAESGPARVWTTTQLRSRDGIIVRQQENLVTPPVVQMWMAHSKIYLPVRQDIASVVVVFDIDQVRGNTLVQLADYATMRGLARTRRSARATDTILALFEPGAAALDGLTAFDRAYLDSLYRNIPNIAGAQVIGGVSRRLGEQDAQQEPSQAAAAR